MAAADGQLRRGAAARLALVAHDRCKDAMSQWAIRNRQRLSGIRLVATGTTGARVRAACPELTLRRLKSGPLGGDQQIGAMIAEGRVDALFFFVDPLSPHPHDVDVKALLRVAIVYDIPMALNVATADRLVKSLLPLAEDR